MDFKCSLIMKQFPNLNRCFYVISKGIDKNNNFCHDIFIDLWMLYEDQSISNVILNYTNFLFSRENQEYITVDLSDRYHEWNNFIAVALDR